MLGRSFVVLFLSSILLTPCLGAPPPVTSVSQGTKITITFMPYAEAGALDEALKDRGYKDKSPAQTVTRYTPASSNDKLQKNIEESVKNLLKEKYEGECSFTNDAKRKVKLDKVAFAYTGTPGCEEMATSKCTGVIILDENPERLRGILLDSKGKAVYTKA